MKKLIVILALIGCSENKSNLIKTVKTDTLIEQDTMIDSFANQIKSISKSIKSNDVYAHKYKDSVTKQLKNIDLKAKYLKMENQLYMNSIDAYVEILGNEGVIDAYLKAGTKDTTK
jgi:hypothetical protein